MGYFNDYKDERYHDKNFITLIEYAASTNNNAAIAEHLLLDTADIGRYKSGYTKQDYDVHLEFEKAILCVESKVDSYENEYEQQPRYQTQRIYSKYKGRYPQKTFFRYVTYGASEFYIKKNANEAYTTGPYSEQFKHIPLANVIKMIEAVGAHHDPAHPELKQWHDYLSYELARRQDYLRMLHTVCDFRKLYLRRSGLTDWPNNRINLCIPEILLFFYSKIAREWNDSPYRTSFGGVSVYPVGRMGKVNDAILNFSELWDKTSLTLNGLILSQNSLYFEFNEDFNLHLKGEPYQEIANKLDRIYQFMIDHTAQLSFKGKYNSVPERYKQGAYVLYEWDLGILDRIDDVAAIVPIIAEVIENAIAVIK